MAELFNVGDVFVGLFGKIDFLKELGGQDLCDAVRPKGNLQEAAVAGKC